MTRSPVTGNPVAIKIKTISAHDIIEAYQSLLGMDVSGVFEKIKEPVCLYQCADTGLQFYTPESIAGGSEFYEQLSLNDWYYEKDRWDFNAAVKFIDEGSAVLEIGCGKGYFLENVQSKASRIVGLELNQESEKAGKEKGLEIRNETIEYFSAHTGEQFDVVASFQVLEHVYDVRSFLDSSLKVLKQGGKLIISVPNNRSILFYPIQVTKNYTSKEMMRYMNMPPHHMGKWDKKVFQNLSKYFPISLRNIEYEPIHYYSIDLIAEIYYYRFKKMIPGRLIRKWIRTFKEHFRGHTILVIFEKL